MEIRDADDHGGHAAHNALGVYDPMQARRPMRSAAPRRAKLAARFSGAVLAVALTALRPSPSDRWRSTSVARGASGQAGGVVTSTNPRAGEGAGSATAAGGAVQRFFKSLPRKCKRWAIWAIGTC